MNNSLAKEIFYSAERFHITFLLLQKQNEKDIYLIPSAIIGALALELYFKSLYMLENGKSIKLHEIDKIFENLNSLTKKSIENNFNTFVQLKEQQDFLLKMRKESNMKPPSNFKDCIKDAGKVFVKARYIYEKEKWSLFFYDKIRELIINEIKIIDSTILQK